MADDDGNVYDENERICKIYDKEDFFTIFVQLMLAAFALASLWIKRHHEVPRRKFRTWAMDIAKQGFGAGYAHVLNMIIAAVISNNIRGAAHYELKDQCAWYGMSYLIDTTLGLALAIWGLHILDKIANHYNWESLKHSGVYSGPNGFTHFVMQTLAWLFILTISKLIMYVFMWACSGPLAWVGGVVFAPLQGNIRFELLFVMILFPGLLNVIYFWIADSFLKAKDHETDAHEAYFDAHEHIDVKGQDLLSASEKNAMQDSKIPAQALV